MRQLAPTVTDQKPRNSPFNGCSLERERGRSLIETAKKILDCFQQVRPDPAPVVAFIEPFQAPVLEAPNHRGTQ